MQKQAPSIGRILVAVGFTLSCFALLLFLWVTFGGPVPFKPESYRFTADFPEAITLAKEADVRIGGVSVGKVKTVEPGAGRRADRRPATPREAEIEIEPAVRADLHRRAGDPPPEDAARRDLRRAHQRAASPARARGAPVSLGAARSTPARSRAATSHDRSPRAVTSPQTQVQDQTQIDEIFHALDQQTREAFQPWMQNAAIAINGRGLDLNDALRQPRAVPRDACDVLGTLRRQEQSLLQASSATRARLRRAHRARPGARRRDHRLQHDLRRARLRGPGAARHLPDRSDLRERDPADARPARSVPGEHPPARPEAAAGGQRHQPDPARASAGSRRNLRTLFIDLDALNRASQARLPGAAQRSPRAAADARQPRPVPGEPQPGRLWLNYYRSNSPTSSPTRRPGCPVSCRRSPGQPAPRHALKQLGYITQESLAIYPNRLPENRGNGYLLPYNDLIIERRRGAERHLPELRLRQHRRRRAVHRRRRVADRLDLRRAEPARSDPRPCSVRPCFVAPRSRTSSAAPSSRRSRKLRRLAAVSYFEDAADVYGRSAGCSRSWADEDLGITGGHGRPQRVQRPRLGDHDQDARGEPVDSATPSRRS